MGLPHVTSFLWCMGLETGAKIIGTLHLLGSLALVVIAAVFAEEARGFRGTIDDMDGVYSAWYIIAVVVACISVVHLLLALTLLVSACKRSTNGIRVWVWVMVVLYAASLIYLLVTAAVYGIAQTGSDMFLAFFQGCLIFGFIAYCILCVYSYYLLLKSSEEMERPNKTDY